MNTDLGDQESKKGLGVTCPILQIGKTEANAGNKGVRGQHFKGQTFPARLCLPGGLAQLRGVRAPVPFANSMLRVGQTAHFGSRSQF